VATGTSSKGSFALRAQSRFGASNRHVTGEASLPPGFRGCAAHCATPKNQNYFHGNRFDFSKASPGMTTTEFLDRDVHSLKELLRVAWMELSSSSLTPYQRREARNRIILCSAELRRHIEQAEAGKVKYKPPEDQARPSMPKPQLRLLPEGY
jgi:hypothetical protein